MQYDINFFNQVVTEIQQYYPDMRVAYKDESTFMKTLGKILFFNKSFMNDYTTTIGSTVYFPTRKFVEQKPINAAIVILHEMMHIDQAKKYSKYLFSFLYLFPQISFLIFLPLLFLSWKIFLPLLILSALPIPAYFRSYFEQQAYSVSLYSVYKLAKLGGLNIDLSHNANFYISQFKGPYYYFMNPFNSVDEYFKNTVQKIYDDGKPFDHQVFNTVDSILNNIFKN